MRPCTVSSWLPVSISSCTPAAPSKAPSLTSLILLLLRLLEGGAGGSGQTRGGDHCPGSEDWVAGSSVAGSWTCVSSTCARGGAAGTPAHTGGATFVKTDCGA